MSYRKLFAPLILLALLFTAGCQAIAPQPTDPTPSILDEPIQAPDRIVAEGEVTPVQFAYLSFSTNGVVGEVVVEEGQAVQEDQVIARLKGSTRLQAALTAAELELIAAEQALDTLNRNADVAKAQAQLALAQANQALDDAIEERDSKNYKRAGQSVIDNTYAQFLLAKDAFETAKEVWSNFEGKDEEDLNRAAALTQYSRAKQEFDRAQANYNYVLSEPDALEVDIAEGELQVAQAAVDQAKRDWELVKDGPNPDDLQVAEARVANAAAQVSAAKDALTDLELTAPFAGVVVTSGLKAGELVGPQSAPVLVADLSTYEVKTTDLTELNVVEIQEGSPVTLNFDAIPDLELTGKVTRINALGEDKQGDITYTVYVALDEQDPRLKWNMTAAVVFEGE